MQALWIIRKTGILERLRIILSIALLSCSSSLLLAQSDDHQEAVYVGLNTTNLIVGDQLSFSAFVYSVATKKASKLSSVLYLELINENGESVYQTKTGLIEGRGSGKIYINSSLFDGTYRLVAYTRWMKNYGTYFEQPILIFNPHNGVVKGKLLTGSPVRTSINPDSPKVYSQMETVSLTIPDVEASDLFISVEKVNELSYSNSVDFQDSVVALESFNILPEYRYAMLQGVIKNDNGGVQNVRLNMTLEGSSMQVSSTKSDEYGRFWMSYNPDLVTNKGVLVSEDTLNTEIEIITENYQSYPELLNATFVLDSIVAEELTERSVITQIKKAYEAEPAPVKNNDEIFIGTGATSYKLSDYASFPSLRDIFIEYVIKVDVSKSETNFKIEVRCDDLPGMFKTDFKALILLDGMISTPETILKLSPNDVERIEVLPTYYFVDDHTFKGVVSVHTNEKDKVKPSDIGLALKFSNFQKYSEEGYQVSLKKDNLPWMEPSVYWKPMHRHNGGDLLLNFPTSRLNGIYQVSIRGISDSGQPINEVRYISVQDADL